MSSVITVKRRVARGHAPLLCPATVTIAEQAFRCKLNWPWQRVLKDVVHRSRTVAVVQSVLMPSFWRVVRRLPF
jgi:hypothetical protein